LGFLANDSFSIFASSRAMARFGIEAANPGGARHDGEDSRIGRAARKVSNQPARRSSAQ
jgi:hypothetical protein